MRVVNPGVPDHVTQRGSCWGEFLSGANCAAYAEVAAEWWLNSELCEEELREFGEHRRTGRPLGSAAFVECLEHTVGQVVRPRMLPCFTKMSIVSLEFPK